ncbi:MAG TPA: hypothetical protein VEO54_09450 [Thermoanaerobaculia bacterium]|nr:hypothetical protein [Thermoanaerobaculia bacterium]
MVSAADKPQLFTRTRTTDATGSFFTTLPPGTKEVAINLAPPGFAYKMVTTAVPERGKKLRIPVSQKGGTLAIEGDAPKEHDYWITRRGAVAALDMLLSNWGGRRTVVDGRARTEVPLMEPGPYTLCTVRQAEVRSFLCGVLPRSALYGSPFSAMRGSSSAV